MKMGHAHDGLDFPMKTIMARFVIAAMIQKYLPNITQRRCG